MKQINRINTVFSLVILGLMSLFASCGSAQKVTATPAELNAAIQDGMWRFNAERAQPQAGANRQLTSQYWVEVKNNKAVFELPYYGAAQGPIGLPGSRGPLQFNSTDYNITKTQRDNGSWLVMLKPKDNSDLLSVTFTFFDNGNATADVIMTNRTPISFTGTVEPAR